MSDIEQEIEKVGNEIRELKKNKSEKEVVMKKVAELLALKKQYLEKFGKEYGVKKEDAKPKSKAKVVSQVKDENKKSKKELNKEKKKAAKLLAKNGPVATNSSTKASKSNATTAKNGLIMDTTNLTKSGIYYGRGSIPKISYIVSLFVGKSVDDFFIGTGTSAKTEPVLVSNKNFIHGDVSIGRYLVREKMECGLLGDTKEDEGMIESWIEFGLKKLYARADLKVEMEFLNEYLKDKSYFFKFGMSLADIVLYCVLQDVTIDANLVHLKRWFDFCAGQEFMKNANAVLLKKLEGKANIQEVKSVTKLKSKDQGGSCPPLKDAIDGQVVTRFPPEPSGYLHIGHVKACMLNHYYAKRYHGKLIVRFDDTNPTKEKAEFEQSILDDLKRLDIVPDMKSHTSDHFELMKKYAIQMIEKQFAYMDNTVQEIMREERMEGIESKCRNQTVQENMKLFNDMCNGNSNGYCLRAKIDMQDNNKTMRDPVLYRANSTPHHRTGTKYKAYPTYDFACPIVDSIEGVTHAMRTTEYTDRDAQYAWIIKALGIRNVIIQPFARMNFVYSVLSKRKLQWFVDNHHVTGWDDPRFPTVQGVLRRGVQVKALGDFILSQGASKRIVDMEWDKFWSMNKKQIENVAARYYALSKHAKVKLTLTNISEESGVVGLIVAKHPKNPDLGNKIQRFGRHLLIEGDDAAGLVQDEEITLMRYGNIIVQKVEKNDNVVVHIEALANPTGDFKKTKKKITWLADVPDLVPVTLVEFDHLLTKAKLDENDVFEDHVNRNTLAETEALGDHNLRLLQANDIIQLERRGYYRVDQPYLSESRPLRLFMIPDGKSKAMSTLSTKLAHR